MKIFKTGTRVIIFGQDNRQISGTISKVIIGDNETIEYDVTVWDGTRRDTHTLKDYEFQVASEDKGNTMDIGFRTTRPNLNISSIDKFSEKIDVWKADLKIMHEALAKKVEDIIKAKGESERTYNVAPIPPMSNKLVLKTLGTMSCPNHENNICDCGSFGADCLNKDGNFPAKNPTVTLKNGPITNITDFQMTEASITPQGIGIGGKIKKPDYYDYSKWIKYNKDGTLFDTSIVGQKGFWVNINQYDKDAYSVLEYVPFLVPNIGEGDASGLPKKLKSPKIKRPKPEELVPLKECPDCSQHALDRNSSNPKEINCLNCGFTTDEWTYKNRNVHLKSGKDEKADPTIEFENGSKIIIREADSGDIGRGIEVREDICPHCKNEMIWNEEEWVCINDDCKSHVKSEREFTKRDCKVMRDDPTCCCNEEAMDSCEQCPISKEDIKIPRFGSLFSYSETEKKFKDNTCPQCGGDKSNAFRCGEPGCPNLPERDRDYPSA